MGGSTTSVSRRAPSRVVPHVVQRGLGAGKLSHNCHNVVTAMLMLNSDLIFGFISGLRGATGRFLCQDGDNKGKSATI